MQAIILAGGKGTRLRPLTDQIPKPLIPIQGKPIIGYIVELLRKHNFDDIIVTPGYKGELIRRYLKDGSQLNLNIEYSYESEPMGTAGCVKNIAHRLNDTFLVISGDCYTNIDLKRATDFHKKVSHGYTIVGKYMNDCRGLGVMKLDAEQNVESFVEKPANRFAGIVNTGIYVFDKKIVENISDGFCDFAKDVFPRILPELKCYKTTEYWSDVGTHESLRLAQQHAYANA